MVDRITIREKLLELEKLRPELLEEAMSFIEYLKQTKFPVQRCFGIL